MIQVSGSGAMESWSQSNQSARFEAWDLPHRDWREEPSGACRGLILLCVSSDDKLFVDELCSCASEIFLRLRLGAKGSSSGGGLRVIAQLLVITL